MAEGLSVVGGEWEQLEAAAESTIAAAVAAVLWAGEDSRGVLARVCAASARGMVASRLSARALADLNPPAYTAAEEHELDEADGFELAALPSSVAPGWAATVCAAAGEATDRCERARRLGRWTEYSAEGMKMWALTTIRLWGDEPLRPDRIEAAARIVTRQRAWSPGEVQPGA